MAEEEKKEAPIFDMEGKIHYNIRLEENRFYHQGQLSNENNLYVLLASADLFDKMAFKNDELQKKAKINKDLKKNLLSPKEAKDLKSALRTLKHYAEQLAGGIYEKNVEDNVSPEIKVVKPKIEVVKSMEGIKKA